MINKLKLRNFKKFDQGEWNFSPGLNIILGKNEAGKSSMQAALFTALFTDATTKARNFFEQVVSWQSQSRDIYLELEFNVPNAQYWLKRDFGQGKQEFHSSDGQIRSDDYQRIAGLLWEKLQIPNEEVFLASAFIRQSELTNIQFTRDLRAALQKVTTVSSQGGNVEANLVALEKELQQLKLGLDRPSKNQGPIKMTQSELEQVQNQLELDRAEWEKFINAKKASETSGNQLTELETQIKQLEKLFENYRKLEDGKKQLALIEEQAKGTTAILDQVRSEQLQLKQILAEMQALGNFNDQAVLQTNDELLKLRQAVKTNRELAKELAESLAKAANLNKINYLQLSQAKDRARRMFELGTAGAIVGALVAGFGTLLPLLPLTIIGIVGLGLGVTLLVIALLKSVAAGQISSERELPAEAQAIEQQMQAVEAKVAQAEARIKEILAHYGLDNASDFFTRKARFLTLVDERKRIEHTIKGNLNGKDIKEVEQRQIELLAEQKQLETQELTPEVRAAELSPNEYLRKRRELDMLLIERKRLEKDTTRQTVISEESSVNYDGLVSLEERTTLLSERLQALNQRRQVLETTIKLLKNVIQSTGQAASTLVSQEVEKYLGKLTNGRYQDLRLAGNYDIEVFAPEKNDWVKPINRLSLGTVDQIYFLTRLALGKTLIAGKLPYLFLDDPFVSFDQERLGQMRLILQELAQSSQIFLFTHNEHYHDWGQTVRI